MFGARMLKKRWVLGVIFGFSLLYFITSIYKKAGPVTRIEQDLPRPRIPVENFKWQDFVPEASQGTPRVVNISKVLTCRNSVQGKTLIADDKGYVCRRGDVTWGGCCNVTAADTHRYVCDSCGRSGCCEIYEHCVSCCLLPEKQPLLRRILTRAAESFQNLYASVTDHFELCLTKCRTSSLSVQHENSYRDPNAKFCYGEDPPELLPPAPLLR